MALMHVLAYIFILIWFVMITLRVRICIDRMKKFHIADIV